MKQSDDELEDRLKMSVGSHIPCDIVVQLRQNMNMHIWNTKWKCANTYANQKPDAIHKAWCMGKLQYALLIVLDKVINALRMILQMHKQSSFIEL